MGFFKKVGNVIVKIVEYLEPAARTTLEITASVAAMCTPINPALAVAISSAAAAGAYGIDQHIKHVERKENRIKEQEALEAAEAERKRAHEQLLAKEQAAQNAAAADALLQEAIAQGYAAAHDLIDQQHAQIAYEVQQNYATQREIITYQPGVKISAGVAINAGSTGYSINYVHGAGPANQMGYGGVPIYNYDYSVGPITVPEVEQQPSPNEYETQEPIIIILPEANRDFEPAIILDSESVQTRDTPAVASTNVTVNSKQESGVIDWCKMAWRSLTGEESAAVMQWQAANRANAPQVAEFLDGVGNSQTQRVVNAFSRGFTDEVVNVAEQVIVKPARFVGEEVARFKLGEQSRALSAAKDVGKFAGSEVKHFVAGETTETGIFLRKVGNFVAADFSRFCNDQETVIGTAITNDFRALANMRPEELAAHLGHEAGNTVMFLFAGGGVRAGAKVLGEAAGAVKVAGKELAAGYEFRSPLVFQFEGGKAIANGEANLAQAEYLHRRYELQEIFTPEGKLTQEALDSAIKISNVSDFNKAAPVYKDLVAKGSIVQWHKYALEFEFDMKHVNNGELIPLKGEVHFYMNNITKEVFYDRDYKIKLQLPNQPTISVEQLLEESFKGAGFNYDCKM